MKRRSIRLAVAVVALTFSGVAAPAPTQPSQCACLLAWNAPLNAPNRTRVAAGGPWSGVLLMSGMTITATWRRGSTPTQTTAVTCQLMLVRGGEVQPITGVWRDGQVTGWSFGPAITSGKAPARSNVKVLPDGRVTKVSRR